MDERRLVSLLDLESDCGGLRRRRLYNRTVHCKSRPVCDHGGYDWSVPSERAVCFCFHSPLLLPSHRRRLAGFMPLCRTYALLSCMASGDGGLSARKSEACYDTPSEQIDVSSYNIKLPTSAVERSDAAAQALRVAVVPQPVPSLQWSIPCKQVCVHVLVV